MKVIVLAGGRGTRIMEATEVLPKPMLEIGERPIIWHIMKIFSHYGLNEFIICLGYKGYLIKEYFSNYSLHASDFTIDLTTGKKKIHSNSPEPWKISCIDTGVDTMTGGRIKRVKKYIENKTFMMTYGDGLGDININDLLRFHKKHGKLATITAVQPLGRFGTLSLDKKDNVKSFIEKPKGDGAWINGGFFVLEPEVMDYIQDDSTSWETDPLVNLAKDGQLAAYKHPDFWRPMDTMRDKRELEEMWRTNKAGWKVW